ncbi:hypothetical protein D187_008618 [Cystobacter fuscus DSM 2262]|uniref:Uncharacterized protein n=1 Tax=Cystobacter fuscus (strain ATCC 25194 / DSM 2262 / NBRC 100088 / M29) TaxID=1242864 RepID=S9PDH5_CYSF2|nr:hypothetical protein [Cystobacter fuscus]EPX62430.1 hypothetical protein D187_008618 [Cystobacter fuscus DSM 2262]
MLSGLLGVLAAGWLAASPPPPSPPAPFHWRVPGLVSTLDVPGEMSVGNIPIRLQVYTSREPVETLLQSFAKASDAAGFYIPRKTRRLARQPHLTALDTRTLTAYTVILNPSPEGLTTVVLGEAKMDQKTAPSTPSLVPTYPGAKHVLQGNFEGARTLSFWAAARTEQVETWYRERLLAAGYKEEEPLVFRRGQQELNLSLKVQNMGTNALLFIKTAGAEGASLNAAP